MSAAPSILLEEAVTGAHGSSLQRMLGGTACAICDGYDQVKVLGAWLIGTRMPVCFPCFCVWYDGGELDTDRIRVKSLKEQGRHEVDFQI